MDIGNRLNFNLAWKKVKWDLINTCFISNPFENRLINEDIDYVLTDLKKRILEDTYNPSKINIIDVPKPDWHLRPGSMMRIDDMIICSALLLDSIEQIRKCMTDSSNTKKFSNLIKPNQDGDQWFEFGFDGWNKFRDESLNLIEQGYKYVLFTDISAFFENIDIMRLISDLESFGMPKDARNLLSACLNRWADPRGRGIPQGISPSFILADVYLNTIDKRLSYEGVKCLRFVDDTRCFFKTKKDAVKGLQLLTQLYREKSLNLQTAKSYITEGSDAIAKIKGEADVIEATLDNLTEEIKKSLRLENSYGTPAELKNLMKLKQTEINLPKLISAFKQYFLSTNKIKFDKSLFHFFINRFKAIKNDVAVDFCLDLLSTRPEETRSILDYFSELYNCYDKIGKRLAILLEDGSILYTYQKFLFIEWILDNKIDSEFVLTTIRNIIRATDSHQIIKDLCISYLGEYGELTDWDLIDSFYETANTIMAKANIMYNIRKMPVSRRNSIYGRARGDNHFIELAIKLAQAES